MNVLYIAWPTQYIVLYVLRRPCKRKLLLELEKKESKRLISCQKLLEEINKSPQHNQQAEPEQWNSEVEVMYLPKPGNWLSISENTGAI